MVKATLMRKQTFNLVVASLTFTAGLISNYVSNGLSPRPASVSAVLEVCAPRSPGGCCEVHGGPLKPVRVQELCGVYEGSDGRGGSMFTARWCKSSALRQISPGDAPFLLR